MFIVYALLDSKRIRAQKVVVRLFDPGPRRLPTPTMETQRQVYRTSMTIPTTIEGPSYTVETKNGWKGVLKSGIPTKTIWNNNELSKDLSSCTTCTGSTTGSGSNGSREGSAATNSFPSEHDISLYWMGGEPSKYDDTVEQQGVLSILKALSDSEREEIMAFDMSVPIRHLRAEKVCFYR